MYPATRSSPASNSRLWAGRILTALPILFLLFDGAIKLVRPAPVAESFAHLGLPLALAPTIGVIELLCTVLYGLPRTALLGAILLTGFLGGAAASQLRIGDPLFSHVLFPLYVGAFVWAGLFLREDRLRDLVPVRSPQTF
jgi:hypothetical protein